MPRGKYTRQNKTKPAVYSSFVKEDMEIQQKTYVHHLKELNESLTKLLNDAKPLDWTWIQSVLRVVREIAKFAE